MSDRIKDILARYERKLGKKLSSPTEYYPGESFSREYSTFRKEALERKITRYESWCNFSEKLIKLKVSEKDRGKLETSIEDAHLNMSVNGALSFAVLVGILIILFGVALLILSFLFGGKENMVVFFPIIFVIAGVILIKPLSRYPLRLANLWRVSVSNQMVLCILYTVMYMRHTSNLERAIKFTGEHIGGPLALDLRKVFWDIETGKYVTIQESLESYLVRWKDTNLEFVEAFHLIESSLYANYEARRVDLLEKALEIELEGTYEKMLHYAQDLKSPITMLYMLGVILPVLGLVIFPMLASFMQGLVKWYHLAVLYNLILPVFVLLVGYNLLVKRPGGYGESEILKTYKEYQRYKFVKFLGLNFNLKYLAILIGFLIVLAGFLPVILHFVNPGLDQLGYLEGSVLEGKFLDYKCNGKCVGPYGVFSLILSLLVPLGIALGFSFYYKKKTKDLIKIRQETKILEKEFSGALFQLGNRIADGIPVEIAFGKVAGGLKGTPIGRFFGLVSNNIRNAGMDVKRAIFDTNRGAILSYPSNLIESSMKILVETARKGPMIVSKSLLTISDYSKRVHEVDERLKDLLADIISSMKSQIVFLTPMIAGIVIAVGSMIVIIVNKLSEQFESVGAEGVEGLGAVADLASFIKVTDVIPSFHFQLIVGLYVVEITFILTILGSGIEKGVDKISEEYDLGRNLLFSTVLYVLIALAGILVFSILAGGLVTISTAI